MNRRKFLVALAALPVAAKVAPAADVAPFIGLAPNSQLWNAETVWMVHWGERSVHRVAFRTGLPPARWRRLRGDPRRDGGA